MSFDHREPGTDPAAWDTFLQTRPRHQVVLPDGVRIVVVAPHPDDETLGAGGLIATAADDGHRVTVVLCTDGEGSHATSPTTSPDRLAALRETELTAALHVLHPGVETVRLGIPDGGTREERRRLHEAVAEAVRTGGDDAASVVLVAPWNGDGHRDHRIAGEVAIEIAASESHVALLQYPVWTWHWDDPSAPAAPWDTAVVLPLREDVADRKRRAAAEHRTQVAPLSDAPGDEAIVDERHARHHLRDDEWYFRPVEGPAPTDPAASVPAAVPAGVPVTHDQPTASTPAATTRPAPPRPDPSRSKDSFDDHYRRHPEGWDFTGSWYEHRKRAVTLASLPRERFRSVLEVGCATGVLTAALAERADRVLGIDISEEPLRTARSNAPTATFARMTVPEEWPDGSFDLVVLSEVGYYLSRPDLDRLVSAATACLTEDGVLLACHWRHPDTEAVTDAATVHAALVAAWPSAPLVHHEEPDFVLDVLAGPGVPSPAAAEGLVG